MGRWEIQRDGTVLGPFASVQIQRLLQRGKLLDLELVRTLPDGEWKRVDEVKDLIGAADKGTSEVNEDEQEIAQWTCAACGHIVLVREGAVSFRCSYCGARRPKPG